MAITSSFVPQWFGQYELLRSLGVGGMAEVFLARTSGAHGFEKIVVLKRILPRLRKQPRLLDMFVEEAKRAVLLQHANIVQILNLDEHDGWPYIVMEYVHGRDLRRIHQRARELRAPLTFDFSVYCAAEVLKGLTQAHALTTPDGRPVNLVHRDVTPENIYVSYAGEVKLGDFGVAHSAGAIALGEMRGKTPYCAPEVLKNVEVDQRADIFSVGVVLWETLSGRDCFTGNSSGEVLLQIRDTDPTAPSRFNPHIAPDLDAITLKAMHRDRDRRFPTAQAFEDALSDYLYARSLRWSRRKIADVMQALFRDECKPLVLPPPLPRQPAVSPVVAEQLDRADASTHQLINVIAGAAPDALKRDSDPVLAGMWSDPEENRIEALVERATIPAEKLPLLDAPAPGVAHVRLDQDDPEADPWEGEATAIERLPVWLRGLALPLPMDVDMLAETLITEAEKVAGVGGSDGPLVTVAELAARLYWDSLATLPIPAKAPVAEDLLENVSLTRLLYEFTARQMTGLILFEDETGKQRRLLLLKHGLPLYVYSDEGRDGALTMLQRLQLFRPTTLFHALQHTVNRGLYLDHALVKALEAEDPATARDVVRRAFCAILRIRLHRVFSWRGGRFKVYPNALRGKEQKWPMAPLLSSAIHGVRQYHPLTDLQRLLAGRGDQAVVMTSRATGALPAFEFKDADLAIIKSIDGKRGIPQLLQANGAFTVEAQARVLSLLYVLSETGLVELI